MISMSFCFSRYAHTCSLSNSSTLSYTQDGASAYYSKVARNWLDVHFLDRWIGRRGTIEWPPRSLDLTPLDFWLWSMLKPIIFCHLNARRDEHPGLDVLKEIIIGVFDEFRSKDEMIKKVTRSVYTRMIKTVEQEEHQLVHKPNHHDEIEGRPQFAVSNNEEAAYLVEQKEEADRMEEEW
jgi:hypothetical protein